MLNLKVIEERYGRAIASQYYNADKRGKRVSGFILAVERLIDKGKIDRIDTVEELKSLKRKIDKECEKKGFTFRPANEESNITLAGESLPKEGVQFVKTVFTRLDSREYLRKYRCPAVLYDYLKRYVIRGKIKNDKYDLYRRYFLDNKLVAFVSIEKMSRDFGFKNSTNSIRRWLKQLEDDGVLYIEKIDATNGHQKYVFVLGNIRAGVECYYADSEYFGK